MLDEVIQDTKRFLHNYITCDLESEVELYYLKAEAKELLDKLNTKTNMKATLMQREYLWDVTADDGTSYGVERIEDVHNSGDSIAIWDEDGKEMEKDNPLYSVILDTIKG